MSTAGRRFAALFPNAFAFVMATGILALGAHALGQHRLGWALFAVNIGAWLVFWAAGFLRAVHEPIRLARELGRHRTGPGF